MKVCFINPPFKAEYGKFSRESRSPSIGHSGVLYYPLWLIYAACVAEKNGFEVAYSNQAFEFWFLLHFNLYQGALHRSRYEKMLSTLLGFAYTKKSGVSSKMFKALFLKQEQAINHAKTIMKQFDGNNPAQQESSTTVYRLVEELNNFL